MRRLEGCIGKGLRLVRKKDGETMQGQKKRYIAEKWDTGDRVDIDIYPAFREPKKSGRRARYKKTSEAQANCNYYTAQRRLIRLVHMNFKGGDWVLTLTYDNGWYPDTEEIARRDMRNYLERMRRLYRMNGEELKYIYVTSRGEQTGRLHHHMICNALKGVEKAQLKKLWKKGKRMEAERLELSQTGCADLSVYLARQPDVMRRRWVSSKNLVQPRAEEYKKPRAFGKYGRNFTKADCEDLFRHNYSMEKLWEMFPQLYLCDDYDARYNAVNGEFYLHFRFYKRDAKIAWFGRAFDDAPPPPSWSGRTGVPRRGVTGEKRNKYDAG